MNYHSEPRDIRNYLERHGYDAVERNGSVVVRDPVFVTWGGGSRTEAKEVVIKDWTAAVRFVEDRS